MSYIVSIRRPSGSISSAEVRSVVTTADDLEFGETSDSEDAILFHWMQDSSQAPFGFVYTDGEIDSSTTPSNAVLRRMQKMASNLDARLIGEEGEDITDISIPESEIDVNPGWGCMLLAFLFTALIVWLLW